MNIAVLMQVDAAVSRPLAESLVETRYVVVSVPFTGSWLEAEHEAWFIAHEMVSSSGNAMHRRPAVIIALKILEIVV